VWDLYPPEQTGRIERWGDDVLFVFCGFCFVGFVFVVCGYMYFGFGLLVCFKRLRFAPFLTLIFHSWQAPGAAGLLTPVTPELVSTLNPHP